MSKRDTSATSAWTVDALMARADSHVASKEYARSTVEEIIDEEAYAASRARMLVERHAFGPDPAAFAKSLETPSRRRLGWGNTANLLISAGANLAGSAAGKQQQSSNPCGTSNGSANPGSTASTTGSRDYIRHGGRRGWAGPLSPFRLIFAGTKMATQLAIAMLPVGETLLRATVKIQTADVGSTVTFVYDATIKPSQSSPSPCPSPSPYPSPSPPSPSPPSPSPPSPSPPSPSPPSLSPPPNHPSPPPPPNYPPVNQPPPTTGNSTSGNNTSGANNGGNSTNAGSGGGGSGIGGSSNGGASSGGSVDGGGIGGSSNSTNSSSNSTTGSGSSNNSSSGGNSPTTFAAGRVLASRFNLASEEHGDSAPSEKSFAGRLRRMLAELLNRAVQHLPLSPSPLSPRPLENPSGSIHADVSRNLMTAQQNMQKSAASAGKSASKSVNSAKRNTGKSASSASKNAARSANSAQKAASRGTQTAAKDASQSASSAQRQVRSAAQSGMAKFPTFTPWCKTGPYVAAVLIPLGKSCPTPPTSKYVTVFPNFMGKVVQGAVVMRVCKAGPPFVKTCGSVTMTSTVPSCSS
ncbi:unnamed protein product [Closterium sp. NIES-53]